MFIKCAQFTIYYCPRLASFWRYHQEEAHATHQAPGRGDDKQERHQRDQDHGQGHPQDHTIQQGAEYASDVKHGGEYPRIGVAQGLQVVQGAATWSWRSGQTWGGTQPRPPGVTQGTLAMVSRLSPPLSALISLAPADWHFVAVIRFSFFWARRHLSLHVVFPVITEMQRGTPAFKISLYFSS